MVGFVWNFSHKLTMMINADTPPVTVKQNHINLERKYIKKLSWLMINMLKTFHRTVDLPRQCIARHAKLNCWKTLSFGRECSSRTDLVSKTDPLVFSLAWPEQLRYALCDSLYFKSLRQAYYDKLKYNSKRENHKTKSTGAWNYHSFRK